MVLIYILLYICDHNIQRFNIYNSKNWKKLRKNILFLIFIYKNLYLTIKLLSIGSCIKMKLDKHLIWRD